MLWVFHFKFSCVYPSGIAHGTQLLVTCSSNMTSSTCSSKQYGLSFGQDGYALPWVRRIIAAHHQLSTKSEYHPISKKIFQTLFLTISSICSPSLHSGVQSLAWASAQLHCQCHISASKVMLPKIPISEKSEELELLQSSGNTSFAPSRGRCFDVLVFNFLTLTE